VKGVKPMKKRLCAAFAVIIFIFLCYVQIAPAGSFINIENIEYGIDNTLKLQKMAEAKITLTNSSSNNFKGKLSFERWILDNNAVIINRGSRKTKIKAFSFSKQFEIAGNSKKVISIPVYFGNDGVAEQYFKIYTSDGRLISSVKVKPKLFYVKNCVGIFSLKGAASDLSYVLENSGKAANVVVLSSKNFPTRESLLEMFEFIIIHNYKTSNLTEQQYQALKDYVAKGGNLIITLGENYQKNLSVFTDDFLVGRIGKEKTGDILLKRISQKDYTRNVIVPSNQKDIVLEKIKYVEFDLKNAEFINQKHMQRIKYGKGTVLVTSFDPFDAQITDEEKKQIFDIIVDNLNTTFYTPANAVMGYAGNSHLYTAVNVKWPNNTMILILIVIYIIFVSFGNYFILRRLNKRHLTWQLILVGSIVWTAIIFGVATFYRINQPNINALNFIVYNSDGKGYVVDKYYQIFAPFKTDIKIKGIENQKIEPLLLEYENLPVGESPTNGYEYYPWQEIVFKGLPAPFMKSVKDQTVYKADDIPLDVNFNIKDMSKITVEINNRSDYEIKNIFVVLYNSYVYIEELEPHSKVTKTISDVYGMLADEIRNRFYNNQSSRIKDFQLIDRETDLLCSILPKVLSNPFLIGHIENYKEDKLNINSEVLKVHSEAVFRKDLDRVAIVKDRRIILPGSVIPNLIKNTFPNANYITPNYAISFYGRGEMEIEYDLSGYLDRIEKVLIQMPKQYGRFNVEEFIFNVKTQRWDKTSFEKPLAFGKDEIEKYFQDYKIKIRIVGKDDRSVTAIPLISAEGGEK